jgi:protein phosphatase
MLVELHAKSDVGRVRRGNEDNFLLLDLATQQAWSGSDGADSPAEMARIDLGEQGLVLVVSDGMGGALAGDVASRMAIESVREVMVGNDGAGCEPDASLVDCLKHATLQANRAIHYKSLEDSRCSGMGATLTGAAIRDDKLDLAPKISPWFSSSSTSGKSAKKKRRPTCSAT